MKFEGYTTWKVNEFFLTENVNENAYQTYQMYGDDRKRRWGSSDDLMQDAKLTLRHELPAPIVSWSDSDKYIGKGVDRSNPSLGIRIDFKLDSGDTVQMFKIGRSRGSWELFLNSKKMGMASTNPIYHELEKNLKPLDLYLNSLKSRDWTSDRGDGRAWRAGNAHTQNLIAMYIDLSSSDKKKAHKAYKTAFKMANKGKAPKFKAFTGA